MYRFVYNTLGGVECCQVQLIWTDLLCPGPAPRSEPCRTEGRLPLLAAHPPADY